MSSPAPNETNKQTLDKLQAARKSLSHAVHLEQEATLNSPKRMQKLLALIQDLSVFIVAIERGES